MDPDCSCCEIPAREKSIVQKRFAHLYNGTSMALMPSKGFHALSIVNVPELTTPVVGIIEGAQKAPRYTTCNAIVTSEVELACGHHFATCSLFCCLRCRFKAFHA